MNFDYQFNSNDDFIIVTFPLNPKENIHVTFTKKTLKVTKNTGELLIGGSLYAKIVPEESNWKRIEETNSIIINLKKQENQQDWPILILNVDEKTEKIDPFSAFLLSEYFQNKQNFHKSLIFLKLSANANYLPSLIRLATIFEDENNEFEVDTNFEKSFELRKKAADLGDMESQKMVAKIYHEMPPQNYQLAAKYYHFVYEKGSKDVAFSLGCLYYEGGFGIDYDDEMAIKYFEESSSQGNSQAMYNLGILYFQGRGVEQNIEKSREFFEKAHKVNSNIEIPESIRKVLYPNNNNVQKETKIEKLVQLTKEITSSQEDNQDKSNLKYYIAGGIALSIIGILIYKKYRKK
ncbi:sel1-repeat-containing protein ybeq [Anaeramoeba ignava]|uniref:Sel1-repeat-containing protein ybeq n=1 Tax=Anaeramoeba ignava TaxID=1746090 RepID=A0A9Q0L6J3_ANAIG|nr:sel1-repeat-containing protein ybeq [Anaeramoeba ignava]